MTIVNGTSSGETLEGTAGSDSIYGFDGVDYLQGFEGDDRLDGGAGADTMYGSWGNDIYFVDNVGDRVADPVGTDEVRVTLATYTLPVQLDRLTGLLNTGQKLYGNYSDNVIRGGAGNDNLSGGEGYDVLYGGAGNDTYFIRAYDSGDRIVEWAGEGTDHVIVEAAFYQLSDNVETATAIGGNVRLVGNSLDNTLKGTAVNDELDGGAGADTMIGGDGSDWYYVDNVGDRIVEATSGGGSSDTIVTAFAHYQLQIGVELLKGTAAKQTLVGNAADNWLLSGGGGDTLRGGLGNDLYEVAAGDTIVEEANQGTDIVRTQQLSYTLGVNLEDLQGTNFWQGQSLTGNAYNNRIIGSFSHDTLDGAAGADTMTGSHGNDIYYVDNAGDTVNELVATQGTDEVRVSLAAYELAAYVENLTGLSAGGQSLTGNVLANVIAGGAGADTIDGGLAGDTMSGGTGDDTYVVDDAADRIVEAVAAGADLVRSSISFVLGVNVENLTLAGSAAIDGTGNELANVIFGNDAANVLTGNGGNDDIRDTASGNDVIRGGGGNDRIAVLRAAGEWTLALDGGDGDDTIEMALAAAADDTRILHAAIAGGSGSDIIRIGAMSSGTVDAGAGNDRVELLSGEAISATISLGEGSDRILLAATNSGARIVTDFEVGDGADVIDFSAVFAGISGNPFASGRASLVQQGSDTAVQVDGAIVLTLRGVTPDMLTRDNLGGHDSGVGPTSVAGTAGADDLSGTGGSDSIDGGAGADIMRGGAGNDSYYVDNVGDRIVEAIGAGNDRAYVRVSWTLGSGVELETIRAAGEAAINLTGNTFAQAIYGNAAANILSGGAGSDSLFGLAGADVLDGGPGSDVLQGAAGNDRYIVDNIADTVIEADPGGGLDTVESFVTVTLGANIENLRLVGNGAINGTGNALANLLFGNGAANLLDGGAGGDRMDGGAGNDRYIVDTVADVVTETSAAGGVDTVESAITYRLGTNVDNLLLTGTAALNGTGNELGNVILGNSAANVLDGGAGGDRMDGGAGNDRYLVDNMLDVVAETSAAFGTDLVESTASFTLGANIETLRLMGTAAINGTGNSGRNTIVGNSAANVLDGGAGGDFMEGGAGDDRYIVDDVMDATIERSSTFGIDSVESSITETLYMNIENLTLVGSAAIDGTGNPSNNILIGNSAANTLSGGAGADRMAGGAGNDRYVVENAGDAVIELVGAGTDIVETTISIALGANVENLRVIGAAAANGTGNGLANSMFGNGAANSLDGGAGDDTLHGGVGTDTLKGGVGVDRFAFDTALGSGNFDKILDFSVVDDTIVLENAIFKGLAAGALASGAFRSGAAAADADDRIVYNSTTGALLFDADGSGAGAAIQFATLQTGLTSLAASDFAVI